MMLNRTLLSGLITLGLTAFTLGDAYSQVVLQGQIKVVSGGRFGQAQVQLKTEKKTFKLRAKTASLGHELERLNKMKLSVHGEEKGTEFEVSKYTLSAQASGHTPQIGHFAGLDLNGQYRILFVYANGDAALLPIGWAKKMKKHVGSKAWMLGEPRDGQLTPRRFGILKTKSKE